jgi:hypothetical protein
MKKWELYALRFGAIQGIMMSLYHFTLPVQFGWAQYMPVEAPTVTWALFALNNYFSFNLLMVSSIFGYLLFAKKDVVLPILILSILLIVFWTFSVAYQLAEPMPLPTSLNWLGYLLPGLALGNALVVGIPAWRFGRRAR